MSMLALAAVANVQNTTAAMNAYRRRSRAGLAIVDLADLHRIAALHVDVLRGTRRADTELRLSPCRLTCKCGARVRRHRLVARKSPGSDSHARGGPVLNLHLVRGYVAGIDHDAIGLQAGVDG